MAFFEVSKARPFSLCEFAVAVFLIGAVALTLQAGLVPASGIAAPPHLWDACDNIDPSVPAGQRCGLPRGLAADPDTGHVFVGDQLNSRVVELSAWGEFIKAWGWDVVATGPGDDTIGPEDQFEVCVPAAGDVCKAGIQGSGIGQFELPSGIALDSAGNVYVFDTFAHRVQKFSPEGQFLLMFGGGVNQGGGTPENPGNVCTAAHVASGDICGAGSTGSANGQFGEGGPLSTLIAITASDKVYVGDVERVQRFDTNGIYQGQMTIAAETVHHLAADSAGNLYLAYRSFGNNSKPDAVKVAPVDGPIGPTLATYKATNPRGLAVAPNGEVYVFDAADSTIKRFASGATPPEGANPLESFGEGLSNRSIGLATNAVTNAGGIAVYFANATPGGASFVRAYSPPPDKWPPPSVPPQINAQYADSVSTDGARVGALIDPRFHADTTYFVEYGTTDCATPGGCPNRAPLGPDAQLGAGITGFDVTVSAFIGGLQPGTTYFYRFVAQSGGGGPVRGTEGTEAVDGPAGSFTTFPAPVASEPCPNDALRTGASAALPDCRAYELVSPLDKNGGDIQANGRPISTVSRYTSYKQAALDGDKLTYTAATAFGDAASGPFASQYIASRGESGWSTHGISPPRGTAVFEGNGKEQVPVVSWDAENAFEGFTGDLCHAWVRDTNRVPLTPDGLQGYVNLYRRSNCGTEGYEALSKDTVGGPGAPAPFGLASEYLNDAGEGATGTAPGLRLQGYSADLSHQVFISGAALTPDAPTGTKSQIYDLHDGELELISILPNGAANTENSAVGTLGNSFENRHSTLEHAVSEDGSRIFWTSRSGGSSANGPGKLYVRVDGAETLPVSEEVSSADARFWTAAADGSAALFTLGECLYRFDVDAALAEAAEPASQIACQAPGVLGAADDLSRIYFISREDLAAGAVGGQSNLYLAEGGTLTLVATLSEADAVTGSSLIGPINVWPLYRTSRVTPDGGQIAFQALGSPTGYDNVDPADNKRYTEVYHYDAELDRLTCVSCNPTGVRPSGPPISEPYDALGGALNGQVGGKPVGDQFGAAALLPTWEREQHASRVLSDDGKRVYFHSYEPLVPRDTNGVRDVYQWEVQGIGSCQEAGGCLELISTGTSPQASEFVDASADGEDVFISTTSNIHPDDEGLVDIYDARVGGGLPVPVEAPECVGDACQSIPAAPNDPTPASAVFSGPGSTASDRDCGALARRAARLSRQARNLRQSTAHVSSTQRSRQLRRRSERLGKRAKQLSGKAKRCRRSNEGGSK